MSDEIKQEGEFLHWVKDGEVYVVRPFFGAEKVLLKQLNEARAKLTMEVAWLVENGKSGDELRYATWKDGWPGWTADPNEATRFSRRIDAEHVHQEDEDAWRIVEHAWHNEVPNG